MNTNREGFRDWELKLFNDFPLLYRDTDKPDTQSLMCYGFEGIGEEWEPLLRELSEGLERLIKRWIENNPDNKDNHPRAFQVKSKFGDLRFYMEGEKHLGDECYLLIDKAENQVHKLGKK